MSGSRAALLLLALTRCTPAPELTPFERAAGNAAVAGWLAAGLPAPRSDVRSFAVLRPSLNEFVRRCGSATAAACLGWADGSMPWSKRRPLVVLAPGQPIEPNGEPILHELMHAMLGDYRNHADPRVWSATGGDASAQGRARALLR